MVNARYSSSQMCCCYPRIDSMVLRLRDQVEGLSLVARQNTQRYLVCFGRKTNQASKRSNKADNLSSDFECFVTRVCG
jgi:hypothetical protein